MLQNRKRQNQAQDKIILPNIGTMPNDVTIKKAFIILLLLFCNLSQGQNAQLFSLNLPQEYFTSRNIKEIQASLNVYIDGRHDVHFKDLYRARFNKNGMLSEQRIRYLKDGKIRVSKLTCSYDSSGNLSGMILTRSNNEIIESVLFKNYYSYQHLVKVRTDSLLRIEYNYDLMGRLTSKRYLGLDTEAAFFSDCSSCYFFAADRIHKPCTVDSFIYTNEKLVEVMSLSCNTVSESNPVLNTISYEYAENGDLVKISNSLEGISIVFDYDYRGEISKEIRTQNTGVHISRTEIKYRIINRY